MPKIRAGGLVMSATAVLLAVAGCSDATPAASGSAAPPSSPAAQASGSDSGSGSSSAGSGATGSGASGSTGSGSGAYGSGSSGAGRGSGASGSGGGATGTSTGARECRTGDLGVFLTAGTGTQGTQHTETLLFENKSHSTCFVQGYPGVSFVAGDQGTQVGRGFIRDAGTTARVELRPGGKARSTIVISYAPNACRPVEVRGYRVIPPDQTTSIFVSEPQQACSDTGQADGHVRPLVAAG
jgi:hypothetical protein